MEVNLTKRVLTPDGRRYCPVVISPNGRIKPDWVEIDGQPVRCPEGSYYLDWTEEGRRQRVVVGPDATVALNSLRRKQREVPVPTILLDRLENYRKTLPGKRAGNKALVFTTANNTLDTHMLRALKRNAKKSGQDPDDFWLHKFRATFATTHLQAGVDLRTVMTWMGQTNLESIIRYLKPARNSTMIEKVNSSFASHSRTRLQLASGTA